MCLCDSMKISQDGGADVKKTKMSCRAAQCAETSEHWESSNLNQLFSWLQNVLREWNKYRDKEKETDRQMERQRDMQNKEI